MSAPPLPAAQPARAAEPGAQGYTVRQATRLTGLGEHPARYCERGRLLVAQGDPALADAIVAQTASEHFLRES